MTKLRSIKELDVERHLLKPLRRRKSKSQNQVLIADALDRLNVQAAGLVVINEVRKELALKDPKGPIYSDPEKVKIFIELSIGLFAAKRISYSQFVFVCSFWMENIFEDRWIKQKYDNVKSIDEKIDVLCGRDGAVKKWTVKEERQYRKLSKKRDEILDNNKIDTFKEFGLTSLADLLKDDPKEFNRLRERGRRVMFHKESIVHALKDVIIHFEEEASKAANAKAYSAAIVALGSGLEGLLILRCLKSKSKAIKIAQSLPKINRPASKYLNDPTRWTFDNLIETCLAAGWLPSISTEYADFNGANLAHQLRRMRNNIHPGKVARETPWRDIDEQDYQDAEAIYIALSAQFRVKLKY